MATDRKADYVGTHGGAYTDMDGMTKQFTYVDHDRHTTRLKIWKGKEYGNEPEPTPLQKLVRAIQESKMNANQTFIRLFDETIAPKYHFERFKKGSSINGMNLTREGDEWFEDIKEAYLFALRTEHSRINELLNRDYGLQESTDTENT